MRRTSTHASNHHGRRGFTLVELTVVLIIVSLLATVTTVSIHAVLPRERLNSDIRRLAAILSGTRSDAIARSATFKVWYDLDNEEYWVQSPFLPDGRLAPPDDDGLQSRLFHNKLLEGVEIDKVVVDGEEVVSGLYYVLFDSMGAASGHSVVLHQAAYDRYYTIEVLPLTGLIRFHDDVFQREKARDSDFD